MTQAPGVESTVNSTWVKNDLTGGGLALRAMWWHLVRQRVDSGQKGEAKKAILRDNHVVL